MARWAFAFFNGRGRIAIRPDKKMQMPMCPKQKNNSQKKGATFRLLLFIIKVFVGDHQQTLFSSLVSASTHSVVNNIAAIEAAFSKATRVTLVGSITPASYMFSYLSVRAL
jgi:hypothetical protein